MEMLCAGMAMALRGAQCASTTLAAACHYVPQLHKSNSLKENVSGICGLGIICKVLLVKGKNNPF